MKDSVHVQNCASLQIAHGVSITFLIVIQTPFHLESQQQRAGDQNLIKDFSWSNSF